MRLPKASTPGSRVPAAAGQLLGLITVLISILGMEFFWLRNALRSTSSTSKAPYKTFSKLGSQSRQTPTLLGRIHVSISFHFNVQRLTYLSRNLETMSLWDNVPDVCIGTNEPSKLLAYLQNPVTGTAFSRKVTLCQINNLSLPNLLNWRTREAMQLAFQSSVHYNTFVFVEDDVFITWDKMLKWEEDSQMLKAHNFTRTFLRYEISPLNGEPHTLDFHDAGPSRLVAFPQQDGEDAKYFVQAGGFEGTYAGMFVATRQQMLDFINSSFWSFIADRFCCDEGGREDASWKIQSINVPEGWDKTGLLPFNITTGRVDDRALLFHQPNNYYGRPAGWTGIPFKDMNEKFQRLAKSL
ncbi:hypothetical protein Naga_100947g2 [Nannochloropsis gaditana]|uniref:Uncharacterized protein n=1 Tax=Nannochloropsis gaditana TaxID=72520 RepID=W7T9M3_9STRA|nr:hypothetical protein Naga_100947g2 [Nannochloropsis gaditana]